MTLRALLLLQRCRQFARGLAARDPGALPPRWLVEDLAELEGLLSPRPALPDDVGGLPELPELLGRYDLVAGPAE